MKLKGILDFSLGNFLCLRGFARMGVAVVVSLDAKGMLCKSYLPTLNANRAI